MRIIAADRSGLALRLAFCSLAVCLSMLPTAHAGRHSAVYGPVPVDTQIAGILQFSVSSISVNENAGVVLLTVTRSGGSVGPASVHYATANGTASAGTNYTATSGTLNWADGNSDNQTITVPVINWTGTQGDLAFSMTLSDVSGSLLGSPSAVTVTINDVLPGSPLHIYVSLAGASVPPYTNWAEAASSIQAAVNVAGE